MKKEIMNTLQLLGLNPRYSGKDKTIYVNELPEQLVLDGINITGFKIDTNLKS